MQHLLIKVPVLILLLHSIGSLYLLYPLMNQETLFLCFLFMQVILLTVLLINKNFEFKSYIFVNVMAYLFLIATAVWVRYKIHFPFWVSIVVAGLLMLLIISSKYIIKMGVKEESVKTLTYGGISLLIFLIVIVEFIRYIPNVYFILSIIGIVIMTVSIAHDLSGLNKRSDYPQTKRLLTINLSISFIICYILVLRFILTI